MSRVTVGDGKQRYAIIDDVELTSTYGESLRKSRLTMNWHGV
ncbi:hypothetical protein VKI22_15840 [Cyanobacterium aponinum UTEX 3221]|nr:hypothetical protein [Cyanobacterium aponinum]WRL38073.1 hypothetical protein VKI22_15840 [Cyanobacterium aponinum UTEX 3221]